MGVIAGIVNSRASVADVEYLSVSSLFDMQNCLQRMTAPKG